MNNLFMGEMCPRCFGFHGITSLVKCQSCGHPVTYCTNEEILIARCVCGWQFNVTDHAKTITSEN